MSSLHKYEGEIQGYATNFFHKNLWKIARTHELTDAMQEAWVVFDKCAASYPAVEPKHFMALYKTSLERRVINLAKVATRCSNHELSATSRVTVSFYNDGLGVEFDSTVGETDNGGYLKRLCSQAPEEVKQVLSLFLSAPAELLESAMTAWENSGHRQSGGNEHVCRLLGLPSGSKPLDAVVRFFSE